MGDVLSGHELFKKQISYAFLVAGDMNGANVKGLVALEVIFLGCTEGGIHINLCGISWIVGCL